MITPAIASGAFLAASVWGFAFTLNARSPFVRTGRGSILAFFAGWFTSELPLVHVALQACGVALFVAGGALLLWPGWVALALSLASWWMLLGIYARAKGSREIVEAALVEGLGADYRTGLAALLPARLDELDRPPALREQILPFVPGKHLIERTPNLPYGPAGWRNHLDIYRRKDRPAGQGRAPVLVNVHGGAWIMGDKDRQAMPLIHHLASLGWVCVAINYRLSPRGTFPDHIVDVKRALAWVKAHIAEYGGDPDFVVLSGGSAGGHLCSLATLSAGDPAYQPGFEDVDLRVQACVPFYGVYDFTNRTGNTKPLVRLLERTVVKKRLADARDVFDKASPMSRVNAGAPPFLVIHGTNDTLVPVGEARLFVELLRKASRAPVVYVELPEAQHAFEVWSSARTAHVIRGVARFLAVVHQRYETERA